MSVKSRSDLKNYFKQGDKPIQQQFFNLIESSSFINIEDKATISDFQAGIDNTKFITPVVARYKSIS